MADIGKYTLRAVFEDGIVYEQPWNTDGYFKEEEDLFSTMVFIYTDGNYSCDCNRGAFIAESKGLDDPDLPCGYTIELVSLTAVRPNGSECVLY